MGKPLIQQRRGKGSGRFRARSFRAKADVKLTRRTGTAKVLDLEGSTHHSAPLMKVKFDDGEESYLLAPEGVLVGQTITVGEPNIEAGNAVELKDIPEGTLIYNIEGAPGDGGKFVRGSGGIGRVLSKQPDKIIVILPSKKRKTFHPKCMAMVGQVAGGGRKEKPLL